MYSHKKFFAFNWVFCGEEGGGGGGGGSGRSIRRIASRTLSKVHEMAGLVELQSLGTLNSTYNGMVTEEYHVMSIGSRPGWDRHVAPFETSGNQNTTFRASGQTLPPSHKASGFNLWRRLAEIFLFTWLRRPTCLRLLFSRPNPSLNSLRQIGGVHRGKGSSCGDGLGRLLIRLVVSLDKKKRFELRRNGCGVFSIRGSGRYECGQCMDFGLGSLFG